MVEEQYQDPDLVEGASRRRVNKLKYSTIEEEWRDEEKEKQQEM